MKILPSIKQEGVYGFETMDIPNLIALVEDSDLNKLKVFNITYQLLGNDNDRFSLEVQKENVREFDCDVISYKLNLDGVTTMIFYLVGDEVKFVYVSDLFDELPKSFEEDFLKVNSYHVY